MHDGLDDGETGCQTAAAVEMRLKACRAIVVREDLHPDVIYS
jgi:hypothetical protein